MPESRLPDLKPRESISDIEHVYSELKRSIMMGEFEPGQKLKLAELSRAFGTSHMPIREALNRLVVARALEAAPRRSMSVPLADAKRLADLLTLRTDLESKALRLAMRGDRSSLADKLATVNDQIDSEAAKRRPSARTYLALNHKFHFTIYRACENDDLTNLIELLWMRYGPLLYLLRRTSLSFSGHYHHAELIDAFRNNDPDAAVAALLADLNDAASTISDYLQSTDG